MTDQHFRYTGDFPPLDVLDRFPNWESALDEEDVEGQDETTLRPAEAQHVLTPDVVFTAGVITQADGTRLPAILEVPCGAIDGLTAYVGHDWGWTLRLLGSPPQWVPLVFEWLPEEDRPPSVSLSDPDVFPLIVESILPAPDGTRMKVVIPRHGHAQRPA